MSSQAIRVEIVIPVHDRREITLQALKSLTRVSARGLDFHIIVVDDGSTDGTRAAVSSAFPEVQIVDGNGTLHYAGGTNRGINAALDRDPDYIVLCNDDSIFHSEFLLRSIETARSNPHSIVGSMLLLWDNPHRTFQVNFRWRTLRGGWQQSDSATVFDLPREPFEVEGLAGNCVLVPADAIRQCGLMDEKRFPHGWGDIQYFVRMRRAGWNLLIDPRSYVWCEPNTNPPPLHTLPIRRVMSVLFRERRHPLNLQRQFIARWESAPSHMSAFVAYITYLFQFFGNALTKFAGRRRHP
jgi:GT2 family glycosyltransferase